jgi:hypothetical protein
MFTSLDVLCTKLAQEHNYQYKDASCCQQKRWDKEESPKSKEAPTFSTSLARLKRELYISNEFVSHKYYRRKRNEETRPEH